MRINRYGRVGIQNTNPQACLHLGNCEVSGSNLPLFLVKILVELEMHFLDILKTSF